MTTPQYKVFVRAALVVTMLWLLASVFAPELASTLHWARWQRAILGAVTVVVLTLAARWISKAA